MQEAIATIRQEIVVAINEGNWELATRLSGTENRLIETAHKRCLEEISRGNWDIAGEYVILP